MGERPSENSGVAMKSDLSFSDGLSGHYQQRKSDS
jgi:hypothetical protein